ncbi:MAG: pyridoxamine 5'-phosphate oxidase family protein, partial [Rhodospirillales bacterium]|nr:pyridoxamine 5'-phosphate oxidase family protein [Rhodospirillales bacterium]
LPDRRGNNLIDSFQNIVKDPTVSLFFFIPRINETLRLRGEAEIVTDTTLLEPHAVNGKMPASGLKKSCAGSTDALCQSNYAVQALGSIDPA